LIPELVSSNTPFSFFFHAAEKLSIPLPSATLPHFQAYYRELRAWNKKVNLTAITEEKEVYIDHFIDSLIPEKFIRSQSTVIDLGSGGGFPGIPLKIVRPDIAVTLVDSSLKKTLFQRHIIRALGLKGIAAVHARTEELFPAKKRYDVCIGRAFAPLGRFLPAALALRAPNGIVIAMKGPNFLEELAPVEERLAEWEISIKLIEKFVLPSTKKRRVIIAFG
jgi:16S rRNA (guanine527-N7)-methyltransferase